MRRVASLFFGAVLAAALLVVPAAPATAAGTWSGTVTDAVRHLPVQAEHDRGYDRGKFQHWIDADGDCQDTRAEVLVDESKTSARGGCTIRTGKWTSYYDGVTTTTAGDLDIDHMVPLAEAWRSGAHAWNAKLREKFANDLGTGRSLVAVTASTNRSKSDRDPASWMPAQNQCRYAKDWTATKIRWGLSVNQAEKNKLRNLGNRCGGSFSVKIANASSGNSSADSVPVYRFWSSKFDNAHFYTVSLKEARSLHSRDKNWAYEGLDFRVWKVQSSKCADGTKPTHRFWSSHFYTTSKAEADDVRANDRNWKYEGVAFCTTGSKADTKPVHRFWSPKFGKHFYTANAGEAKGLRQGDPNWNYEGIAWRSPKSGASVDEPSDGVKPDGNTCPAGYPIKGNQSSSGERIYHVPGGSYYDRTNPEECFATEGDARKAGYRASQR